MTREYRSFRLSFSLRVSRWLGTGAPAASVCFSSAAWVLAGVFLFFHTTFRTTDLGEIDFSGFPILLMWVTISVTFFAAAVFGLLTGVMGLFRPRRGIAMVGIIMAIVAVLSVYTFVH